MSDRVNRSMLNKGWRTTGLRFRIGLAGGLWAGFILSLFTFCGGRTIFMEHPLSLSHRGLEKNCGLCHHGFKGVTAENCALKCHTTKYDWSKSPEFRQKVPAIPYKKDIHFYSGNFENKADCLSCHLEECHPRNYTANPPKEKSEDSPACEPKNVQFLRLPKKMDNKVCAKCHTDGCQRSVTCADCHNEHRDGMLIPINRPDEVLMGTEGVRQSFATPRGKLLKSEWTESTVLGWEKTRGRMHEKNCMGCHPNILHRAPPTPEAVDASKVSRSIFRHDSPGHRKYWHCTECHRRKFPLKRDVEENIFTMEACSKRCHYNDDCAGCHRFHDPINRPGERVDWPERLRVYDRVIGIESTTATMEEGLSTEEAPLPPPAVP